VNKYLHTVASVWIFIHIDMSKALKNTKLLASVYISSNNLKCVKCIKSSPPPLFFKKISANYFAAHFASNWTLLLRGGPISRPPTPQPSYAVAPNHHWYFIVFPPIRTSKNN